MSFCRRALLRAILTFGVLSPTPIVQASSHRQLASSQSPLHGGTISSTTTYQASYSTNRRATCQYPWHFEPDYECGLLQVPLDWQNPDLGLGQIYYARRPASPDVVRKGTIFIDIGVPTTTSLAWTSHEWLSKQGVALQRRLGGEYDIVVWDARGKGAFNLTIPGPMSCFENATERDSFHLQLDNEWELQCLRDDPALVNDESAEEIRKWHFKQSRIVEHCLAQPGADMLAYVGTAATTRDLVAMADAFDGPGSPVNFWSMSHGALIGAYLLRMFPERAGRVILDGPMDPESYALEPPYSTWIEDVSNAHELFGEFANRCATFNGYGCKIANHNTSESDHIIHYLLVSLALSRTWFLGNRITREADSTNTHLGNLLQAVAAYADHQAGLPDANDAAAFLDMMSSFVDELGLGVMPIYCGDRLDEHNATSAHAHTEQIVQSLAYDRTSAPFIATEVFPAFHYLCHLWPVRAAERYPGTADGTSTPTPGGNNNLAPYMEVLNSFNPLEDLESRPFVHKSVADDREVFKLREPAFGVPLLAHSRRAQDRIVDYLRSGRLRSEDLDGLFAWKVNDDRNSALRHPWRAFFTSALERVVKYLRAVYPVYLYMVFVILSMGLAALILRSVFQRGTREEEDGTARDVGQGTRDAIKDV